jgi:hypothetical protein
MPGSPQTAPVLPPITYRHIAIRDSHKKPVTNIVIKVYAELVNRNYNGTNEQAARQPGPHETGTPAAGVCWIGRPRSKGWSRS